tara:strand:- start:4511 stop:4738 length:228 start_codon:yes stop_codon:yes gene_type:complete
MITGGFNPYSKSNPYNKFTRITTRTKIPYKPNKKTRKIKIKNKNKNKNKSKSITRSRSTRRIISRIRNSYRTRNL